MTALPSASLRSPSVNRSVWIVPRAVGMDVEAVEAGREAVEPVADGHDAVPAVLAERHAADVGPVGGDERRANGLRAGLAARRGDEDGRGGEREPHDGDGGELERAHDGSPRA